MECLTNSTEKRKFRSLADFRGKTTSSAACGNLWSILICAAVALHCVYFVQTRSETKVLQDDAAESAATRETSAVISNKQLSAAHLQSLSTQAHTFINAGISDIYKQHGSSSFSDRAAGATHGMPWFPFDRPDSFRSLDAAFGMKADEVESRICPTVKTEPKSEPLDCRIESDHCLPAGPYTSAVDNGDGLHAEFDMQPMRAVASVAPTQLASSAADSHGDVGIPVSHFPPPLVPLPSPPPSTTGQVLTSSLPFVSNVLNSSRMSGHSVLPGILGSESRSSEDVSESEAEPDDGHCSPPPERVHVEAHRSRNAM